MRNLSDIVDILCSQMLEGKVLSRIIYRTCSHAHMISAIGCNSALFHLKLLNQFENTGPPPADRERIKGLPTIRITEEHVGKSPTCLFNSQVQIHTHCTSPSLHKRHLCDPSKQNRKQCFLISVALCSALNQLNNNV